MPSCGFSKTIPIQVTVRGETHRGTYVPGVGIQPTDLPPSVRFAMMNALKPGVVE